MQLMPVARVMQVAEAVITGQVRVVTITVADTEAVTMEALEVVIITMAVFTVAIMPHVLVSA